MKTGEKTLQNFTRLKAGYKLYIRNDLYTNEFIDFCKDLDNYKFDWHSNSKYARFAVFQFGGCGYYIKRFANRNILEPVKSFFKGSRAMREFRGNQLLIENGVNAPLACAVIEGFDKSYIITEEIKAKGNLYGFLKDGSVSRQLRRQVIVLMAEQLGGLHKNAIAVGDLNMSNVLVDYDGNGCRLFILDNERTSKTAFWGSFIRNLVQLNKSAVDCATSAERLRFLKIYEGIKGGSYRDGGYLAIVIKQTIKRRAKRKLHKI